MERGQVVKVRRRIKGKTKDYTNRQRVMRKVIGRG